MPSPCRQVAVFEQQSWLRSHVPRLRAETSIKAHYHVIWWTYLPSEGSSLRLNTGYPVFGRQGCDPHLPPRLRRHGDIFRRLRFHHSVKQLSWCVEDKIKSLEWRYCDLRNCVLRREFTESRRVLTGAYTPFKTLAPQISKTAFGLYKRWVLAWY